MNDQERILKVAVMWLGGGGEGEETVIYKGSPIR